MSNNDNYPGRETDFFVVLGGVQTGPVHGLVELFRHNISPETPVWYRGLDDWKPAIMCSLTRQLFEPGSEFYRAHPEALTIMQGRATGADPSDMPDLVDDLPVQPSEPAQQSRPVQQVAAQPVHTAASQKVAYTMTNGAVVVDGAVEKPKNFMAWSIVMAVLFSLIPGIVAIIFSCRVNSKWAAGDIEAARTASERAQLWIVLSFIIGVITMVANFMLAPFSML